MSHRIKHMHAIEHTYISLLADIGRLSQISSIRGSAYEGLDWCVKDAPLLDKKLLAYEELRHDPEGSDYYNCSDAAGSLLSEIYGTTPQWLLPLVDKWVLSGKSKDDPLDAISLGYLRQLLGFCYKAEHTYTDETEAKSVEDWIACQYSVSKWEVPIVGLPSEILIRARKHCTSVLSSGRWKEIIPSHGPGAVYDSKVPKGKWSKWFETIEAIYPFAEYFDLSNEIIQIVDAVIEGVIVARLTSVPKDSRGPRLICVHPAESIWIQQGVRRELERCVQKKHRLSYSKWIWPVGHVHFDTQEVNASLALSSSKDRHYATLDLKEASDRLADPLVQNLFGRYYKYFGCSRAGTVHIPSQKVCCPVSCYAPMGNATTFPVQSLVFWSLCVATLEVLGFHQPSDVYVFGDDIIVPSSQAKFIMDSLEQFGLVVNQGKSFYKGFFRESCGCDAYNGVDITPIRWKTTYDAVGTAGLLSISDLAQRLRQKGFQDASTELYSILNRRLRAKGKALSRTNNPDHGGIAEYTDMTHLAFQDAYWHQDVQWYVNPVIRLEPRTQVQGHDWYHVLSSLTRLALKKIELTGQSTDPARTPLRGSRLKRGWTPIL